MSTKNEIKEELKETETQEETQPKEEVKTQEENKTQATKKGKQVKKIFIYSTLSADQIYCNYNDKVNTPKGVNQATFKCTIKGGANIVNKKSLDVPAGAMTEITDEQLKELEKNNVFKLHKENGFITVKTVKEDIEEVAKTMTKKDKSAQLTKKDIDKKLGKDEE